MKYEETVKISKNGDGFTVKTEEGEYECGAVIIATGTEPRKLSDKQIKDAGERPILYCATCDGALYRDKPVVVGSGNVVTGEDCRTSCPGVFAAGDVRTKAVRQLVTAAGDGAVAAEAALGYLGR